jgi:Na+-driven multidrug efflux pump
VIPLGMPSFLIMAFLSVTLTLESHVIAQYGSSALSVQTITGYLFSITESVVSSIMSAGVVLMSYCVGAGNKARFIQLLKLCTGFVLLVSLAINLPLVINSEALTKIFTDSIDLIHKMKIPALVYGLSAPFIFGTNVLLYAMQPIGLEKTSAVVFVFQQVLIYIPMLFLVAKLGFCYAICVQPGVEIIGGILTLCLLPQFIKRLGYVFDMKELSFKEGEI